MVSRNASGICDRRGAGIRLILSLPDSLLYRRNDRKAETKTCSLKEEGSKMARLDRGDGSSYGLFQSWDLDSV
jgi:hypothetical protein